ncbi:nuclear transport factor 2 family protein [Sphingorhabdus sp.]|jgi:ketosteroid isomerase-like protein|uniref:nuclear transport factor 2 family protein n=1 Tax=Sphingorhabdus sp. TaxID=1902408 RepID=UPI0037CA7465
MTATEDNKAIVVDFFATFSKGDVPGVIERLHEDGSWWVSGAIEGMSGTYSKGELAGLLDGARSLYREGALQINPTSMTAEGDRVAVEAKSFATMEDGRVYANSYHFLLTVRDGKVTTVREYMDTIHARETFFGC